MPNVRRAMMGAAGSAGGGGYKLWMWGANSSGQLGIGDVTQRLSPVQVGTAEWASVAMRSASTAAIKTDGSLWMWGINSNGELGQNDVVSRSSPVQVGALNDWSFVALGEGNNTAAIKTDGTLWTWGTGAYGALGVGDTLNRSSPTQVGGTNWSVVSPWQQGMLGIRTDGTLWAWGRNVYGSLGVSPMYIHRSSPIQIGSSTDWSGIAGWNLGGSAVKTNGTLWTWGFALYGITGQGDTVKRSSPTQVGALTNWASVSAFAWTMAAVKTDGTLWTWGTNPGGQLGVGDTVKRSSPVQVGALTNWSIAKNGPSGMNAFKTDGTMWGWGDNKSVPGGYNISSPVQVGAETDWVQVAASSGGGAGLRS